MLFLPLLDKTWHYPRISLNKFKLISWLSLVLILLIVVTQNPDFTEIVLITLLFTALPEEWFFRAYFMKQLENTFFRTSTKNGFFYKQSALLSNLFSSGLFALLHTPTQGWFGLSVFFPSLFYGWIYQRTSDIVLVVLLHTLSNAVFYIYFRNWII